MAAFKFKLNPLLKHRQRIEDDKQRRLAQLLRQKLILETQLRNQQQSITDDKHRLGRALVGHVDVDSIRRHAAHSTRMSINAQSIAFRLFELTKRIDLARAELIEATRQRRAIELLRDKQERRWRIEIERRQTAELDELATQAYARGGEEAAA